MKVITKAEDFVPEVIESGAGGCYGIMLVKLNKCPICGKHMLVPVARHQGPFPIAIDFDAQIKKAGWVRQSIAEVDGRPICQECSAAGKADFLCQLCKERRPTSKIKESFGDPPEFLCQDCYSTVPAEIWDKEVDRLEKEHQWDFE